MVLLLVSGGLVLHQPNRWDQQLLQGDGGPPRNRLPTR
jgi:hypothetical protein